jgi:hypothetical protein
VSIVDANLRVHVDAQCSCSLGVNTPHFAIWHVWMQGDTSSTPVEVQTSVTGATLHAFGKQLALPIRWESSVKVSAIAPLACNVIRSV